MIHLLYTCTGITIEPLHNTVPCSTYLTLGILYFELLADAQQLHRMLLPDGLQMPHVNVFKSVFYL